MINLNNLVGDNVPGVRTVYFTEANNVFSIASNTDYLVSSDITLIGTAVWYTMGFAYDTARLRVNEQRSRIGSAFNVSLDGAIAKPTAAKMYSLNTLINRNFVLVVIDRNGLIKIIGDEENYLRLSLSESSGRSAGEANQVGVNFTGKILKKPQFYNGNIIVEPPPEGERGVGFDIIGATNIIA